MKSPAARAAKAAAPRYGIARVLSKLGYCSRTQAAELVRAGRVALNGVIQRDPERPVDPVRDRLSVDGTDVAARERVYLMINKPRGLVTTTADERGRDTVYRCLEGATLPWLAPVGRLDKASEGLLLMSNDNAWSAALLDPDSHLDKIYHVQVDRPPAADVLAQICEGTLEDGERLSAKSIHLLRQGEKTAWLQIVLDEGKNRQIRRLLDAFDIKVLRLIRIAIGSVTLGDLAKGSWRMLTEAEIAALSR